jgi:hypothetical protein
MAVGILVLRSALGEKSRKELVVKKILQFGIITSTATIVSLRFCILLQ